MSYEQLIEACAKSYLYNNRIVVSGEFADALKAAVANDKTRFFEDVLKKESELRNQLDEIYALNKSNDAENSVGSRGTK